MPTTASPLPILRQLRRTLGRWRRLVQALSVVELVEVARVLREPRAARAARLAQLSLGEPGRLVFVCYGNIMRSAFAAAAVQTSVPLLASRTVGAGTHAVPGRAAQRDALVVAPEFGVSLVAHRASRLDAIGVTVHDVLVGMDLENVARARMLPGVDPSRVFLIGDAITPGERTAIHHRVVDDPYGHGLERTRAAFQQVLVGALAFAGQLLSESVPDRVPAVSQNETHGSQKNIAEM
jgi:protein-tyrosine-phosphatase